MTAELRAGPPLEPFSSPVGRTTTLIADERRQDRLLGIDCWYPARNGDYPRSVYELLPGIGFTSSALADPPAAPGSHPLMVWSHGRSGTRSSYSMLCEGLAARGYVVIAPDHPGDTLADWLLGAAVDDATNETQRVDDVRFVIDAALGDRPGLTLIPAIDAARVAIAGHSYGAFTAFALAGGAPADARVRGVAGLQSFTRTLSRRVLARIDVPTLMIVGARDLTTPPDTDADRAFAVLAGKHARRIDIEHAGHQACSDVGLYLELAPRVEGLPDLVADFLQSLAEQVTGRVGDPWRPTVGLHLRILGAWLDELFERNGERARRDLVNLAQTAGVEMLPIATG
jgi:predicted dienelactone hydrolase